MQYTHQSAQADRHQPLWHFVPGRLMLFLCAVMDCIKNCIKHTAVQSGLRTRKHKPDFQHKKAVTASATLALHKVVLRVFSLYQHFLCKNGQKCTRQITIQCFGGYLCFFIRMPLRFAVVILLLYCYTLIIKYDEKCNAVRCGFWLY